MVELFRWPVDRSTCFGGRSIGRPAPRCRKPRLPREHLENLPGIGLGKSSLRLKLKHPCNDKQDVYGAAQPTVFSVVDRSAKATVSAGCEQSFGHQKKSRHTTVELCIKCLLFCATLLRPGIRRVWIWCGRKLARSCVRAVGASKPITPLRNECARG